MSRERIVGCSLETNFNKLLLIDAVSGADRELGDPLQTPASRPRVRVTSFLGSPWLTHFPLSKEA
jgi:hypothetical protein